MKKAPFLLIILLSMHIHSHCQVRIMLSAALTHAHYEYRKKQYIEAFRILDSYGYHDVYVVEALRKHGPTFLEKYSKNVFYSTANNPHVRNQGINEALTTLQGTYYFKFDPEDMILKLTGRYELLTDNFLRLIEDNEQSFDAFVKVNENGDVYTLGFAMRCKYYQEMYQHMNFKAMESHSINLETEVGNYIKRKIQEGSFRVCYVDKMDIKANIFGSSAAPGAPDQTLYY